MSRLLLRSLARWIASSSLTLFCPRRLARLSSLVAEEVEDIGDKVGCCTLVGGKQEIDVITETSLGQSVVSVRQDCSMEGVRLPARSTIAR